MKTFWATILAGWMLAAWSSGAAVDFLLSDNLRPGQTSTAFAPGQPVIHTGADLQIVADGEFASCSQFIATAAAPDGKGLALRDGDCGPRPESMGWGNWAAGPYWETVVFDLKQKYLITRAAVWPVRDDQRGMDACTVLLSQDGKTFVPAGTILPGPAKSAVPLQGVQAELSLPRPALARYVMLRAGKKAGIWQMILAEAAVYGRPPPPGAGADLLPENQRPPVAFQVTGIQSGAVTLDWSGFAKTADTVKQWKIYEAGQPFATVTAPGVSLRAVLPSAVTRTVIYPLTPGKPYVFAVTAEYANGEYPHVRPITYRPPMPFACEKLGDMLAVNHFWGGGGARMPARPHAESWEQAALDILGTTPFTETRWWCSYPEIVDKLYEQNLGLCCFPGPENFANGAKLGVRAFSAGNEPEFSGRPLSEYLDGLKKNYALAKKTNPANSISAPTSNLDDNCLDWLDRFYAAGAKPYFDVLDLHTYLKLSGGFKGPEGYPADAPESLLERMEKVRAIMTKYGDGGKPVISTEFGYTDYPPGSITPEDKARFIVRGLILHYVLGFKRVYVYSFWDEGDDTTYSEHGFGMLDYYLQKKPVFYAFCNLGRQLGDCALQGSMAGVTPPHFGYNFKNPRTGQYVAAIWDGTGTFSGTFATAPGKLQIVDMMGNARTVPTGSDGTFRSLFGASPIYIHSTAPVSLRHAVKVTDTRTEEGGLGITIPQPVCSILPGHQQADLRYTLCNRSRDPITATVNLEDASGKTLASKTVSVAGSATMAGAFAVDGGAMALSLYRLVLNYEGQYAGFSDSVACYVRKLQPNTGKTTVTKIGLYGYDQPVWAISNDRLEVTVDPQRGGRILEILDKTTGVNQVNLPYDKLNTLKTTGYYSIWDEVRSTPGFGMGSTAPYQLATIPDGVVLTAGQDGKLQVIKQLTLKAPAELVLEVKVTNLSAAALPVSYYLHPEYTVGGAGESGNDVISFPVGAEIIRLPFWTGLGERNIAKLSQGWWAVTDTAAKVELKQAFSLQYFRQPRIWFGLGCYNLEMETVDNVTLAPGASWQGTLTWQFNRLSIPIPIATPTPR